MNKKPSGKDSSFKPYLLVGIQNGEWLDYPDEFTNMQKLERTAARMVKAGATVGIFKLVKEIKPDERKDTAK